MEILREQSADFRLSRLCGERRNCQQSAGVDVLDLHMRLSSRLAAVVVIAVATGLFSASWAVAGSRVPPGLSGATQYTETLPGPGGNKAVRDIEGGKSGSQNEAAQALGKKQAARLEALGPEGRAAAHLAAAGAVIGKGDGGRGSGKGDGGRGSGGPKSLRKAQEDGAAKKGVPPRSSGSSAIGQIVDQVTGASGSTGMGLLQPALIVLSAIAALFYIAGRRRTFSGRN